MLRRVERCRVADSRPRGLAPQRCRSAQPTCTPAAPAAAQPLAAAAVRRGSGGGGSVVSAAKPSLKPSQRRRAEGTPLSLSTGRDALNHLHRQRPLSLSTGRRAGAGARPHPSLRGIRHETPQPPSRASPLIGYSQPFPPLGTAAQMRLQRRRWRRGPPSQSRDAESLRYKPACAAAPIPGSRSHPLLLL